MKSDIQIAQEAKGLPIKTIARQAGIPFKYVEMYGTNKAKINLDILNELPQRKGKLVLVTAINPTPAGEGKTTTTIALGQALWKSGVHSMIALREPSMGPVFGLKGGATGGGYAQVLPMEDINLHFTGDMHAITCAVNLVAACLDNHLYQGNELNIDPRRILWRRALDVNDRSLRSTTIGMGPNINGVERHDGFDITVASEIMAILCLSKDLMDFKERVSKAVVAFNIFGKPITIGDLKISGAIAVIMKEAIKPNLVQTLENTPVLIHGGPFANIAHGCNSMIATDLALRLSDVVVTEAGFGADLGAEKFLDIKCRYGNFTPNLVVIVATIRALKMHGGVEKENLNLPNVQAIEKGLENLQKHVENIANFNLPFIITINRFESDTNKEVKQVCDWCQEHHYPVEICTGFAKGSKGALSLAKRVMEEMKDTKVNYTYRLDEPLRTKIEKIAKNIYGAKGVEYDAKAVSDIERIEKYGYDKFAVCMAKTPNSLSDNPKAYGCPRDFTIRIREVRVSVGAELIVPIAGTVLTMPGLPKVPAAENIDIDKYGFVRGLF